VSRRASKGFCSASAGPAGVRGPVCQGALVQAPGLDRSFLAANSLQVRTAPSKEAATSLQQLGLRPDARDRRFKEALEQPFWSTLEGELVARLWRALGRLGAPRPFRLHYKIITCAAVLESTRWP